MKARRERLVKWIRENIGSVRIVSIEMLALAMASVSSTFNLKDF